VEEDDYTADGRGVVRVGGECGVVVDGHVVRSHVAVCASSPQVEEEVRSGVQVHNSGRVEKVSKVVHGDGDAWTRARREPRARTDNLLVHATLSSSADSGRPSRRDMRV
jgi:hypothetical protein